MGFSILQCDFGCCRLPQRYVLCLMAFCGMMTGYFMRSCLNLAITEMVMPTKPTNTTKSTEDRFSWTEDQQQVILAAFYYGYALFHLPGGWLSDTIGGKPIFLMSIFISALFTATLPVMVDIGGWQLLVGSRFIVGFAQGALFPCVTTLLARWVPRAERSKLGAWVMSAPLLGHIIVYPCTSYIIHWSHGWRIPYYVWGGIGFLWCIFFQFMCSSEPKTHPFIPQDELDMLMAELGERKKLKVPWVALLTDVHVLGAMFGNIMHCYYFFMLSTELPKYLGDVLKCDVQKSGMLNSALFLTLWISSTGSGMFASWLLKKECVTELGVRRWFTVVANVLPSCFIMGMSYMGCDQTKAAVMFVMVMLTMGPIYPAQRVNIMDLTKNFAGIGQAYINVVSVLCFAPFPNVIAKIAHDNSVENWRIVWWILVGITNGCLVLYVILCSVDRAEWDKVD